MYLPISSQTGISGGTKSLVLMTLLMSRCCRLAVEAVAAWSSCDVVVGFSGGKAVASKVCCCSGVRCWCSGGFVCGSGSGVMNCSAGGTRRVVTMGCLCFKVRSAGIGGVVLVCGFDCVVK